MSIATLLKGLRRTPPPKPPRAPIFVDGVAPPVDRTAIEAAVDAPEGTPVDPALLAAIAAEIAARRAATGTLDGPAAPIASDLAVRRDGLPDWWHARRNLLLCAPGTPPLEIGTGILNLPGEGAVVVIGRAVHPPRFNVTTGLGKQGPGLIVIGDDSYLPGGNVAINGPSTVLIGEKTTATFMPGITAHNGGIVVTGADGMWAPGVQFMTDDSHAIVDLATGKRINRYGGRIVIGRHVWLGWQVSVMGDTLIGDGGIVGQGSMVRNARFAANVSASGRPARALRENVSWTREDTPPDAD